MKSSRAATRINPNSSIRSGYAFEDLYVLKLCAEWLHSPDRYKSIRIQYVPDGLSNRFAIDDVVATLQDDSLVLHQLKHAQNVDTDPWTVDKLVDKGLNKWITSVTAMHRAGIRGTGRLITNGVAAEDIQTASEELKLDYTRIPFGEHLQSHSNEDLQHFFDNFEFHFAVPGKADLEEAVRESFYSLNVTQAGFNKLWLTVAQEGSEKYPRMFTLSEIRSLLSWDNPRPLNQEFNIPVDFEFFDKHTHRSILTDLQNPAGGIKVFTGKPGTGKSTYLAKLYEVLKKKKNVMICRHHYHLSPKDSSAQERLNSDRAREAMRAELKKMPPDAIAELRIQNTADTPLREFIKRISSYCHRHSGTFVLIVDGLDHVIRESKREGELEQFLNDVLYPQPGFWLLLGTQEVVADYLPNVVHRLCPRDKWIEIKGFKKQSVTKIVAKALRPGRTDWDKHLLASLANEIFAKTQGNALHLRYILSQLGADERHHINSLDLQHIPAYTGEIQTYYEELWRILPALSKTFAFAITSLDFRLQEEQLFELASYFASGPHEIPEAYKRIDHLVRKELHGLSVYHNSFAVFLENRPELAQQRNLLLLKIREWLLQSSDEELKWSELAKIENQLGNPEPLLNLDRAWVIDSFLSGRDEQRIVSLLELAVNAAVQTGNLEKAVQFQVMQVSFANREQNFYDILGKIWSEAFISNKVRSRRHPDFQKLEDYQIRDILIDLHDRGEIHKLPVDAAERLNDLLADRNYGTSAQDSVIELLAHLDGEDFNRAYKYIIQFRRANNNASAAHFVAYVTKCLSLGKDQKITYLLASKLTDQERALVLNALVRFELMENSTRWEATIQECERHLPDFHIIRLYRAIRYAKFPDDLRLPLLVSFPANIQFHSTESDRQVELALAAIHHAMLLCLSNRREGAEFWINQPSEEWQHKLVKRFVSISVSIADSYRKKRRFAIGTFIAMLDELAEPDYPANGGFSEYRRTVVPRCVQAILDLIVILNAHNGFEGTIITDEDVNILIRYKWFFKQEVVAIVNGKGASVPEHAYAIFRDHGVQVLGSQHMTFKDRAEHYVDLAKQARLGGKTDDARYFLTKAADTLVSYGNHKDMLLHRVLQAIEHCAEAGSPKVESFLRQIAAYIYNIGEMTDGDETRGFIYNYSELLSKYSPHLLFRLYIQANNERDYYRCESFFTDIIRCLDFGNPVSRAIGATALDKTSFFALEKRATDDANATAVLDAVLAYVGDVRYRTDKPSSYSRKAKEDPDPAVYRNVPPSQLLRHLERISPKNRESKRLTRNAYFEDWVRVWINDEQQPAAALAVAEEVVDRWTVDMQHEILDYIYTYALKVNKGFAFKCLVRSAANGSIWYDRWLCTNEDSRAIWGRAMRDFPGRLDEFYDRSVYHSGEKYNEGVGYFVPFPKSVLFNCDRGNIAQAEAITQMWLNAIPLLFPNVDMPTPQFLREEEQDVTPLDVLFKRFEWVSPLIRERAATGIADLLQRDESGEVHERMFRWLRGQQLESLICNGLLVLIKSLDTPGSLSAKHLEPMGIEKLVPLRCTGIDLLLASIAKKTGKAFEVEKPSVFRVSHLRRPGNDSVLKRLVTTYLNRHYLNVFSAIAAEARSDAWAIWWNFYKDRCAELGIDESPESRHYGRQRQNFIIDYSPLVAEVLKSTFFTTLDFLFATGEIRQTTHFYRTFGNYSIDSSLWNIALRTRPEWWPGIKSITPNLSSVQYEPSIQSLPNSIDGKIVLYVEGSVFGAENHYEAKLQANIWQVPFLYKVNGPRLPKAKDLFDALTGNDDFYSSHPTDMTTFNFFDGQLHAKQQEDEFIDVDDVQVMQLVLPTNGFVGMTWQYFRFVTSMNLLAPRISEGLELTTTEGKIHYQKNGATIAECFDFLMGMQESSPLRITIPAGTCITIDRKYLEDFMQRRRLRLGYVCMYRYGTRDSSVSDHFDESYFYETFGLSPVII